MSKTLTSKQYLSQLSLIYFAQVGMMLIFAAVVFALNFFGNVAPGRDETTNLFMYLLTATVIAGFSAAHFIYGYMISKLDKNLSLQKKLPKYSGIVIVRVACVEFPSMFASVVFYLTANVFVLLIPLFAAIVLFLLRPTAASIAEDLNLTPDERLLINDPQAVVAEFDTAQKK